MKFVILMAALACVLSASATGLTVDPAYAKSLVAGRLRTVQSIKEYPTSGDDKGKDIVVIGESSSRYSH
jgi:hypothetical protein